MATRYVTKHGSASDSNGGTNATTDAWATALKGFSSISGGDTLKFGTGTYDVARSSIYTPIPNGSEGSPTIITDNGDGVVTFNHPGSGFSGIIYYNNSPTAPQYISFIGTSVGQLVFDGEDTGYQGLLYFGGNNTGTDITLQRVTLKRALASGIYGGDTTNLVFDDCDIFDNGSLTTNSTPQDHGIYASGPGLVVKNSRIYDNWGWGIHCYPSNGAGRQFYNNWVYNNGYGSGSDGSAGDGILMTSGSGTIYNNLCFKNAGSGIRLWRTTSSVSIYHNTCHENGRRGVHVGTGSGVTSTVLVKNNLITNNATGSIYLDVSSKATTLDFNNMDAGYIAHASSSGTTNTNQATDTAIADECTYPTNATLASRNYALKSGADSIWDASTNNVPSVGVATDIAGTDRVHPDQGAYAFGTPDPPDPPVIGHLTNYPVTAWTLEDIALTLFDNDGNTKDLTLDGSADGVSIEFGDTTNCTVT